MHLNNHHARILHLETEADLNAELKLVGAAPEDHQSLLNAKCFVLKLKNVGQEDIIQLKKAAADRNLVIIGGDGDVILSGARHDLIELAESLTGEINIVINAFEDGPLLPDDALLPDTRTRWMFSEIQNRTLVMGILNVTPDSFSDGGRFLDHDAALQRGLEMVEQGADIIDIGGESSRPGSEPVPVEEEIKRVVPIIRELAQRTDRPISIDTYKARTAQAALDAGAVIINDISGMAFDPDMKRLAAERRCPVIIMHIKGVPREMQKNPTYKDLMGEITDYLRQRIADAIEAGVNDKLLIVDPGIGFGKTVDHNLEILRRLSELKSLGRPILIGTSRKATIGHVLGGLPPEERVEGTAATVALSIASGANIVRVHDVKEMSRVVRMTDAVIRGRV